MQKILITGATGFVGKNLINSLIKKEKKWQIITINRNIDIANKIFVDKKIINLDLNDTNIYEKINNFQPDIIIHLAAFLTSSRDENSLNKIIDSNILFPTKLLNFINKKYVKYFFNFGTFAEYKKGTEKISNAYLYSASKTAFRSILDYYSEILEFKYFNLIPYTIYGKKDSQKKVIDYIYESIESQNHVKMSLGEQILDFIHIDDICEYIYRIIKNREQIPNKENLFLGTGIGTSIRSVSELIEQILEKKVNIEWGALEYRENDIFYAVAPIQKNRYYLNWNPKITLEEGIKKYFEEVYKNE